MQADHALCCDCDRCLNGSRGLVLRGAGRLMTPQVTVSAPGRTVERDSGFDLRSAYVDALLSRLERRQEGGARG